MNLPEFLRASPPPDPPRYVPLSFEEADQVEDNLLWLNSEDPYEVEAARKAFVSLGVKAVPRLSERMIDADGKPHAQVMLTLMRIGPERIVAALPELVGREKVAALRVLGALGRQAVTEAVIRELASDDPPVRAAAAAALGKLLEPGAVPHLERRVEDADPEVRTQSLAALGNLRSAGSVGLMIAALRDRHVHVRRAAATALATFDDPSIGDVLCAALWDDDVVVRSRAALGVGLLGRSDATPRLLEILANDPIRAREAVITALGRCGDETAIGPLCALLKVNDVTLEPTCSALSAIAPRHPVPHLRAALPDLDSLASWFHATSARAQNVRSAAATAREVIRRVTAEVRHLPTPATNTNIHINDLPVPGMGDAGP